MLDLGYSLDTRANWKDYFGLYKKYVLPNKRKTNKEKNKDFYESKMKDLKSKLELLEKFKYEKEIQENLEKSL